MKNQYTHGQQCHIAKQLEDCVTLSVSDIIIDNTDVNINQVGLVSFIQTNEILLANFESLGSRVP